MKKIVIFSDSHGDVQSMVQVVKKEEPDLVLHLGDCMRDAERLKEAYPNLRIEMVPGNCDMSRDIPERVLIEEGFRILMCHGHTRCVKTSYLNIELAAQEKHVDIALFGHTHHVYYAGHNGILFLNPGSIGNPPIDIPPSYAILMLEQSTQNLKYDVKYLSDEA